VQYPDPELLDKLLHPRQLSAVGKDLAMADAVSVIRTLRFERDSWRDSYRGLLTALNAVQQEVDELRPDAVRFRYLCATADTGRDLRAEVDAEMEKNSAP
jgi:hypothetical protein